jgi:DNA-binding transcriptional ArsR family regulator
METPDHPRSPAGSRWLRLAADPVRLQILQTLSEVSEATASELRLWGHMSNGTLRRHLDALVVLGLIRARPGESDGETPGRPPVRFSLDPKMREQVQAVFETSP